MHLSWDCAINNLFKKFPDLQFLTADRMSLVTHFSSNGWTIPLNVYKNRLCTPGKERRGGGGWIKFQRRGHGFLSILFIRGYWMIFKGPFFLVVSPVSKLSLFPSLVAGRAYWRKRGGLGLGERRGAKSCDREKAWSSINNSILSAFYKGFLI